MFSQTDARRVVATVLAALFMSTLAVSSAVGPAQSVSAQIA